VEKFCAKLLLSAGAHVGPSIQASAAIQIENRKIINFPVENIFFCESGCLWRFG